MNRRAAWVVLLGLGGLGGWLVYWLAFANDSGQASATDRSERSETTTVSWRRGAEEGCPHPYLHATPGDVFEYVVRSDHGTMRIEVRCEAMELQDGRLLGSYRVRLDGDGISSTDGVLTAWCEQERGAELPLDRVPVIGSPTIAASLPRWFIPETLNAGNTFGESVPTAGGSWERDYRVVDEHVEVTTAAGTFDTVALELSEHVSHDGEDHTTHVRLWLSTDVGLARSAADDQVIELATIRRASR